MNRKTAWLGGGGLVQLGVHGLRQPVYLAGDRIDIDPHERLVATDTIAGQRMNLFLQGLGDLAKLIDTFLLVGEGDLHGVNGPYQPCLVFKVGRRGNEFSWTVVFAANN